MTFLAMLLVGLVFLVMLPLLLLKLILGLIWLPFKLLGFALRLVFGLVFGIIGLVFSGAGLLVVLLFVVAFAVVIPLLPILLIGVGLWLLVRAAAPKPPLRLSA
jgi:hypothetical protein